MHTANSENSDILKNLIYRIERLQTEKSDIQSDISEVFKEAKRLGFDTKVMRSVIKLRKMSQSVRDEHDSLVDAYLNALQ